MEKKNWYNLSVEDTVTLLDTNLTNGLTEAQAAERVNKYGYNELKQGKKKTFLQKFLAQFKDTMIIILILAAVISGVVGILESKEPVTSVLDFLQKISDSFIILLIVIVNAVIGVLQENKAEKSLEALKKLSSPVSKVLRDGQILMLPGKELVPGDIVILDTGDYIPADLRLFEAANLKIEEASLTGESVPVEKITSVIEDTDIPLGDRDNLAFSASLVSYGRGKDIVAETGMNT